MCLDCGVAAGVFQGAVDEAEVAEPDPDAYYLGVVFDDVVENLTHSAAARRVAADGVEAFAGAPAADAVDDFDLLSLSLPCLSILAVKV